MFSDPKSTASRCLVAWYGVFQAAHVALNARYQLVPFDQRPPLPFAPPPEGWQPQLEFFLSGMAVADLVNAAVSLVVVFVFFRNPGVRWLGWLGTVTLTVSVYAAVTFTWGAVVIGAPALSLSYWWVNLPFIPVAVLAVVWSVWVIRGRLA